MLIIGDKSLGIWNILNTLEEYKVIYPKGKPDYITKDSDHFFVSKFLKDI